MLTQFCCPVKATFSSYIQIIITAPTIILITMMKLIILYFILKTIRDFYFEDFSTPKIISTQHQFGKNQKSNCKSLKCCKRNIFKHIKTN